MLICKISRAEADIQALAQFSVFCHSKLLKGQSRLVLAKESADLHKDHWCYHVNILWGLQQLADDIIIVKLIVTSSYGEVSGPYAQLNHVDTPNSPYLGL